MSLVLFEYLRISVKTLRTQTTQEKTLSIQTTYGVYHLKSSFFTKNKVRIKAPQDPLTSNKISNGENSLTKHFQNIKFINAGGLFHFHLLPELLFANCFQCTLK